MTRLTAISLAALILAGAPLGAATAAPAPAIADQALASRIGAAIGDAYKADEPGAVIIVTKDGKPVFRKAYGLANLEQRQPMDAGMAMRLGSVTKQFTAAAILMLQEEGKLSLGDEITKYLPDYPVQGRKITIEHLLTHTSGIQSYTAKPGYSAGLARAVSVGEMIDSFKNEEMAFEPGTRYAYNNSGYYLLGAIIEKISGQPYAKFVEQRIFVPLGMNDTAYEGFERTSIPHATGHSRREGFVPGGPIHMSQAYAAGALVSTADDMARWGSAIASGKLLSGDSWKKATTAYKLADGSSTGYGYGFETGRLNGYDKVFHGGRITGFKAFTLRVPEKNVFVAVLSNADNGLTDPEMVANKAAAVAMGVPFPEFRSIAVAPDALTAYTGIYRAQGKPDRTVRIDNGRLVMQRTGGGMVVLDAYRKDGFVVPGSLTTIDFERDAKGSGAVNALAMATDGGDPVVLAHSGEQPVERKAVKIADEVFDAYVGRYQVAPGFLIEVKRADGKYYAQATGQPPFELFPLSDSKFFVKVVDAEVRFEKTPDGGMQLFLSQNGKERPARRI